MDHFESLNWRLFFGILQAVGSLWMIAFLLMFLLRTARRFAAGVPIYKAVWRLWKKVRTSDLDDAFVLAMVTAVAMLIYFVGRAIASNWGAAYLYAQKHGIDMVAVENQYPIALVGSIVAAVGFLMMIRVYSHSRWKHWGWLSALITSMLIFIGLIGFDHSRLFN